MEKMTNIKNFAAERKAADTGSRNLLEIYQHLHNIGIISEDQILSLKQLELSYEMQTSFPIKQNIDKVQHGDLLVSDMYMSGADILSLVRSVGLDKQVSIYQSNGDKRTGYFWNKAKETALPINKHFGDNNHSDVSVPNSLGFTTEHFINSIQNSNVENYLVSSKLDIISYLVREIRLRNDEKEHKELFFIANQLNIPWLLFTCEMIYRKYKGKNVVFLSRDCQLLYKMYNAFYEPCYYLPFSRKVALNQTEVAARYLQNQTLKDSVIIDISSTGRTWEKVCSVIPFNISVVIYSDKFYYSKNKPNLPETFSWFSQNSIVGQSNPCIELFNCGDHGYLSSIDEYDNIYVTNYGDMEIDKSIVDVIHKPINDAVSLVDEYRTYIRNELASIPEEGLMELFKGFLAEICSKMFVYDKYSQFFANQDKYMKEVNNE